MPKTIQPSSEDFLVCCGLAALGYGLYLRQPWLAFVVVGAVLTVIGLAVGRAKAIHKASGQQAGA